MTTPAAPTSLDRAQAALRGLVLAALPALKFWIVHEYAVAESDGLTFSGTPTDPASPALPTRVPYAPALSGSSCIVPVGTLAYVGFANADPSKPYLVRFAQVDVNGAPVTPSAVTIDGHALALGPSAGSVTIGAPTTPARYAREGDTYTLGLASGVLTFVSTPQPSGPTKGKG